jgi:hypothetical protein
VFGSPQRIGDKAKIIHDELSFSADRQTIKVAQSKYKFLMKCFSLAIIAMCVACAAPNAQEIEPVPAQTIYWSDGDSGRLDGMKFRLANIDAPETGGIGARGGAKCEAERALRFEAKAYMISITKNAELVITQSLGPDRYDREVIYLSANGIDVAQAGIDADHLGDWPHKGRRALAPKPDWCDPLKIAR